jgi:hypothetical protein
MLRPDLSALSVGAVGAGAGAGWSAPPGRLRLADSDSCPHCDEVHAPDAACIGATFGGKTKAKVRSEKTLTPLVEKARQVFTKAQTLAANQQTVIDKSLRRQMTALWGTNPETFETPAEGVHEPKFVQLEEEAKNMAAMVAKLRASFRDMETKKNNLEALEKELEDARQKQSAIAVFDEDEVEVGLKKYTSKPASSKKGAKVKAAAVQAIAKKQAEAAEPSSTAGAAAAEPSSTAGAAPPGQAEAGKAKEGGGRGGAFDGR